jgi:hypothetical protein
LILAAYTIDIQAGQLSIQTDVEIQPLTDLCTFASRRNPKRGYLFVSKVLGKHLPVKPSVMRQTYRQLVAQLPEFNGQVLFLGMAETATGLGYGIFDEYLRQYPEASVLAGSSTRYLTSGQIAMRFTEPHSHAVSHLVYWPENELQRQHFQTAEHLVLIDDEITTGTTLRNLLEAYLKINSKLKTVTFVSLTDWLPEVSFLHFQKTYANVSLSRVSLVRGSFTFTPNTQFIPSALPNVIGRETSKDSILAPRGMTGYLSRRFHVPEYGDYHLDGSILESNLLVLGSGEFLYQPFKLAETLEAQFDGACCFQSTTRSPILVGDAITSCQEFMDNYDDHISNYLYNLSAADYSLIGIGYETRSLPSDHQLPNLLSAIPLFFPFPL